MVRSFSVQRVTLWRMRFCALWGKENAFICMRDINMRKRWTRTTFYDDWTMTMVRRTHLVVLEFRRAFSMRRMKLLMLFSSEETLRTCGNMCDHRFVILRVIRRHFTRTWEKRKSTKLKIPCDRYIRETLRHIALLARKTYFRITAHQNVIVI